MRNEGGLESIVQIRDKSKVVDGHKGNQLQVLDQDPNRLKTDTSPLEQEELRSYQGHKYPIHVLSNAAIQLHVSVAIVKLHFNTHITRVSIELVNGLVTSEASFVFKASNGSIEEELFGDIKILFSCNENLIRSLEQKTHHVRFLEGKSEVNCHVVRGRNIVKVEIDQFLVFPVFLIIDVMPVDIKH